MSVETTARTSLSRTRLGGAAAILGGVVGILYAPLYALAYFATDDGASSLEAPLTAAWAGAVLPFLEPLLTFASPQVVYLTYGKLFSLVVLGWLCGLLVLHASQAPRAGRAERWGFRLAGVGMVLAFLGSVGAYWLGSWWWGIVDIAFIAFLVPSLLLLAVGLPLFGLGTLRARIAPRAGAWLLIAGGLPGMLVLNLVFGQLAMGFLLADAAWIVLGSRLLSQGEEPALRPARRG